VAIQNLSNRGDRIIELGEMSIRRGRQTVLSIEFQIANMHLMRTDANGNN
jgi:hypothetical protein